MKSRMVGLFAVALIALMVAGLAYAYWTDLLTIEGTVTTGTFGWEWSVGEYGTSGDTKELIEFTITLSEDKKTMTISAGDVYPCTKLWAYLDLEFVGSVPGIITDISVEGTLDGEELTEVPDWIEIYCEVTDVSENLKYQGITVGEWDICELGEALIGTQWHEDDYIEVYIEVHFFECEELEVEVPQDATLEFTVEVSGIQYNAALP